MASGLLIVRDVTSANSSEMAGKSSLGFTFLAYPAKVWDIKDPGGLRIPSVSPKIIHKN